MCPVAAEKSIAESAPILVGVDPLWPFPWEDCLKILIKI
jgi:hypothetical protein